MIKALPNKRRKKINPKTLLRIKDRLEIYYQPFEDRKMEELKGRYHISISKLRDKIKTMKKKAHTIRKMEERINRLKLIISIVELLQFIVRKEFMSEKVKNDISHIISSLKDMNYEQLVKQFKMLKQAKHKLIGG